MLSPFVVLCINSLCGRSCFSAWFSYLFHFFPRKSRWHVLTVDWSWPIFISSWVWTIGLMFILCLICLFIENVNAFQDLLSLIWACGLFYHIFSRAILIGVSWNLWPWFSIYFSNFLLCKKDTTREVVIFMLGNIWNYIILLNFFCVLTQKRLFFLKVHQCLSVNE